MRLFPIPATNLYLCAERNKFFQLNNSILETMKHLFPLLAATLLIAVAASCCPCRKASSKAHSPLKTTEWTLVQIGGENIASMLKTEGTPRLVFAEDGSFGGYGGCNSLGGQYEVIPSEARSQKNIAGKMRLSNVFSTKRMCPNDELESRFFSMLAVVDSFTIDGDKLLLFSDGELKLLFTK